jgi:glycosyltransferase involved in cell wall biosynthesis
MRDFRRPILIAPRLGAVSTPIAELFERFNVYGQALNSATGGGVNKLLILGSTPETQVSGNHDFIEYSYVGKNPIFQFFRILIRLRSYPGEKFCFIAGDIWLGGLQTLILKAIFSSRSVIQISIHGIPSYSSNLVIKPMKIFFFRYLLSHVNSIRVVSNALATRLFSSSQFKDKQIFVAPVPLRVPEIFPQIKKSIDVAIVGRLHPERGVREATQILELLISSEQTISIQILGDGPLFGEVQEWRSSLSKPDCVVLLGHVQNLIVSNKLLATRILLSCAPEEGYGLALREALCCGAYVVARRNSGTQELLDLFPEAVFLFDTQAQALETLLGILTENFSSFDNQKVIQKQRLLDGESLSRLALSWIN